MTSGTYTVEAGAASERLDVYLSKTLERPRAQAQRLAKDGHVLVNGKVERPSYLTQPGDVLEIHEPAATLNDFPAPDLQVMYEDSDLIVVDKPAGLAVHSGAGLRPAPTVADFARSRTTDDEDPERPGIVHRLDRDTSGLLIIAKHPEAKAFMQAAFRHHEVQKTYSVLLVGSLKQDQAVIKLPLGRDPAHPLQQTVVVGGREATTAYEATRRYPGFTLVVAKPASGRTHQLRVHFSALGHPVAGDVVYGPPKRPLELKRQFLHATGLEFTAPSGEHLSLSSPLPNDLQAVIDRLEAEAPAEAAT